MAFSAAPRMWPGAGECPLVPLAGVPDAAPAPLDHPVTQPNAEMTVPVNDQPGAEAAADADAAPGPPIDGVAEAAATTTAAAASLAGSGAVVIRGPFRCGCGDAAGLLPAEAR